MDDMNDPGSYKLKLLDLMNCLELWMMLMILLLEVKPLDVMNCSGYG